MNYNHNIDDLLKVVSPSLIAGYEKKNKVKLADTNWEYKNEYRKIDRRDIKTLLAKTIKIQCILASVALIISWIICFHLGRPVLGLIAIMVICSPHILHYYFVTEKRSLKIEENLSRCEPILEAFRTAVKGLNPFNMIREYTEVTVRDELVHCAVRILDAEVDFDAARFQKERRTHDILQQGNWLEKCHAKFDGLVRQAQLFGLEFSNEGLYADAKKHIEQSNEMFKKLAAEKTS